ncbi:MAG: glycosyltransferase [Pseudomonadota bacterium]
MPDQTPTRAGALRDMTAPDYFRAFDHVRPPVLAPMTERRRLIWQLAAAFTLGLGAWYLHWRWTASLNPDALLFSAAVAGAETLAFLGTLLFFYDIWEEGDTPRAAPPRLPAEAALPPGAVLSVDVMVTTYDEDVAVLEATLEDAARLVVPPGWTVRTHVLDDGNRPLIEALARRFDVGYITRAGNRGFKAGNLRNALTLTDGEFVVICDADTRLFPTFLDHTLGYFRDPSVAWVQTPHWFYDIPEGEPRRGLMGRAIGWLTGDTRSGRDPYLSGSMMFFDVIQRRRNRHGASFCCGAASIHRREPLFLDALDQHRGDRGRQAFGAGLRRFAARMQPLQPFRFHVSEDIYTSILLHGDGGKDAGARWRSVYHPQVESKMLSPWSMEAWSAQKLKYAGGTLDLMLRVAPTALPKMPWKVALHYAATFWSYVSCLVLVVLLAAPVITLFTGLSPVATYSVTFFLHLLPVLLANELAFTLGAKGQDGHQGRVQSVATLPITLRAFWLVLRGKRVRFAPTPKIPLFSASLRFVWPQLLILAVMAVALGYGVAQHVLGSEAHSVPLLIVNAFWIAWCGSAFLRVVLAALWAPKGAQTSATSGATVKKELSHV